MILSNLRVPGMNGEDLYRRVEHGWPHLAPRFVFVTGEEPGGCQTQYGGAPVPVLTKPYTPERPSAVFAGVIARDLERWRVGRRWPSSSSQTGGVEKGSPLQIAL